MRTSNNPVFRHCELRGTKQEAIQNFDIQWIASDYRLRNDVCGKFSEVPISEMNLLSFN
jgi:hypothetical protein